MTGSRYLGVFVGSKTAKDIWQGENVKGCQDLVATLAGVARCHPQNAYVGLQNSFQQEWAFVQRITLDIGMDFQVVEDALQDIFPLALFQGATEQIPGRAIISLPVKHAGIALPDQTRTVGENWTASCMITGHLVAALWGTAKFRSGDHALLVGEGRGDI